jgi:hypothetical protein
LDIGHYHLDSIALHDVLFHEARWPTREGQIDPWSPGSVSVSGQLDGVPTTSR